MDNFVDRQFSLLVWVWVCCCVIGCVFSFNVDVSYPLVYKGPRRSQFGYSVAILENAQGTWLLVGAPSANDSSLPGVHQPGALFQCNWLYRSSCHLVLVDNVGNVKQTLLKNRNVTVHHLKDNQGLGTSVDVNIHGDSQVMVCAPRWTDRKFEIQDMYLMNGLCYETKKDLKFDESSMWPVLENWKKQVHADGYFLYGMGSLGSSVAYSKDGKFCVMGAPGLNDWAGGFVQTYDEKTTRPKLLDLAADKNSNSYFGMAVTTGKLSVDGVVTIVGGPRAGGAGQVYVYNSNFQLLLVKEGTQIGSSFGASLCAVDLNGDGLDDLVVGAPFFSEKMEEGRAYIYMNREFFNLELMEPPLAGSNLPGARFGTAVANVGDLNLDRYEDLAVGAPWEEEAGVVYIYNGAKSGIHSSPAQRIVGKNIARELKTFGWSFSHSWDVDGNFYGDFAVGTCESDRVVLLRTRPVIDLHASLKVSPSVIDLDSPAKCTHQNKLYHCVEASVCLHYTGQNLPPSAELNITLYLDTQARHLGERSRLFLSPGGVTELESLNDLIVIRLDRISCVKKYTVYFRASRDVITPLEINLEFKMASSMHEMGFVGIIEPVLNKYRPTEVTERILLASGCGKDQSCRPDLQLVARPIFKSSSDYLLIDDSTSFDVEVAVVNKGDVSHLTVVSLSYPSFLVFSMATVSEGSNIVNCIPAVDQSDRSITGHDCHLMTPVRSQDKVVILVKFYAYHAPFDVQQLEITTNVQSTGQTNNSSLNQTKAVLTIPIRIETQLGFTVAAMPAVLTITSQDDDADQSEWSLLSHIYMVRNLGPSPLPHGRLTLMVPSLTELRFHDIQIQTTGKSRAVPVPVECSLTNDQVAAQANQSFENTLTKKIKLECDPVACQNVTCYLGLVRKNEAVHVNITLAVKSSLLNLWKDGRRLSIKTSGVFRQPDYASFNSLAAGITVQATTDVWFKTRSEWWERLWWLLVISVISGLLLLYLLVIILWKCGFMRRKKKEQLHLMIRSLDSEQEILHSDSPSAGSGDLMVQNPRGFDHSRHNQGLFFYPLINSEPESPDQWPAFQSPELPEQHLARRDIWRSLEPCPQQRTDQEMLQPLESAEPCPSRGEVFQSHSLHRAGFNEGMFKIHTFHTLQCNHPRVTNVPRSHSHSRSFNPRETRGSDRPQLNVWIPPPSVSNPIPSFNNEMYLEPSESRA